MELYTLGVDGGYTQADVIAMAKLLTGWGVYADRPSGFGFFQERHEPGPITLRGKTYPAGWDGSVAAIRDLAHDPATARNIARKFATHFIADDPPKESVARLEKSVQRHTRQSACADGGDRERSCGMERGAEEDAHARRIS